MIFQKLSSVGLLALAVSVAAEPMKFTKASPNQFGLLRMRQLDTAYEPETTECGAGNTCAEACGAGYLECAATDEAHHCFNPDAGETCCKFPGKGNSCETGYFCAHDADKSTICCADGKSLDECARINQVGGGLTSDPPMPSSTSTSSTSTSTSTSSSSAWSSKMTSASASKYPKPTANSTEPYPTKPASVPQPSVEVVKEAAAAHFGTATAAVLLAAGVFAALF